MAAQPNASIQGPMYTIEQIELIRRLRNSGISKEQLIQAFDSLDRLDRELGPVYTIPLSMSQVLLQKTALISSVWIFEPSAHWQLWSWLRSQPCFKEPTIEFSQSSVDLLFPLQQAAFLQQAFQLRPLFTAPSLQTPSLRSPLATPPVVVSAPPVVPPMTAQLTQHAQQQASRKRSIDSVESGGGDCNGLNNSLDLSAATTNGYTDQLDEQEEKEFLEFIM